MKNCTYIILSKNTIWYEVMTCRTHCTLYQVNGGETVEVNILLKLSVAHSLWFVLLLESPWPWGQTSLHWRPHRITQCQPSAKQILRIVWVARSQSLQYAEISSCGGLWRSMFTSGWQLDQYYPVYRSSPQSTVDWYTECLKV